MPKSRLAMSVSDFVRLPITFGPSTYADILGCGVRYVSDHALALGGTKVAGQWRFSKVRVARDLGLDVDTTVTTVD